MATKVTAASSVIIAYNTAKRDRQIKYKGGVAK